MTARSGLVVAADVPGALAVVDVGCVPDRHLPAGDVVVASALTVSDGHVDLPPADLVAAALRRRGTPVGVGPVAAADIEAAWLPGAAATRLTALVRVAAGPDCAAARQSALSVLTEWAGAVRPREVVLAGPRSFCAGVERAVGIVERAIERFGRPVYVRRQIVHNAHVVAQLEQAGAVFVQELDEVPSGATVVLSAHGVSPAVRHEAAEREMHVIDATCPLVAKVHNEARRFSRQGRQVVLIGHRGHDEVEGTLGEVPGTALVGSVADVAALGLSPGTPVGLLTQTTLASDEVAPIADAVRRRFPATAEPASSDICFATQNRQEAVRAVAAECDVVLVVGSANSSNSNRLVEVAERAGTPARLVEDRTGLDIGWLRRADRVGVSAGASTPEAVVSDVVGALAGLGPVTVSHRRVVDEDVFFQLPPEVR